LSGGTRTHGRGRQSKGIKSIKRPWFRCQIISDVLDLEIYLSFQFIKWIDQRLEEAEIEDERMNDFGEAFHFQFRRRNIQVDRKPHPASLHEVNMIKVALRSTGVTF
jgi:hypothetical protein